MQLFDFLITDMVQVPVSLCLLVFVGLTAYLATRVPPPQKTKAVCANNNVLKANMMRRDERYRLHQAWMTTAVAFQYCQYWLAGCVCQLVVIGGLVEIF